MMKRNLDPMPFCPSCGKEVQTDVNFCYFCGFDLKRTPTPKPISATLPGTSFKKPWLAAVLNFFLWGLGYVYVGNKIAFGIGLFISDLILNAAFFYQIFVLNSAEFISGYAYLIMAFVFAYDGHKEAEKINEGKH